MYTTLYLKGIQTFWFVRYKPSVLHCMCRREWPPLNWSIHLLSIYSSRTLLVCDTVLTLHAIGLVKNCLEINFRYVASFWKSRWIVQGTATQVKGMLQDQFFRFRIQYRTDVFRHKVNYVFWTLLALFQRWDEKEYKMHIAKDAPPELNYPYVWIYMSQKLLIFTHSIFNRGSL